MIGLAPIEFGLVDMSSGDASMAGATFANGRNLLLSRRVPAPIVVIDRSRIGMNDPAHSVSRMFELA